MDKTLGIVLVIILVLGSAQAWAGATFGGNPNATSKKDSTDACGCTHTIGSSQSAKKPQVPKISKGMPVYSFKSLLASLNIHDTPIGYTPPVGPQVYTTITYNEREANQPTKFNFFNVGHKWTLNWLSWIQDDPEYPGSGGGEPVLRYVSGGGAWTYHGYNSATGTYAPERDNGAVLALISTDPIKYELRFANGAKEIFSKSNGATYYPRRVLLTRIVDPQGNAITLNYDSSLRLTSVTDAIGQQTTFQYGNSSNPLLVTGITGPFGRHATLQYDAQGRLDSITDEIGMTSTFAYDSGTFVKAMTTPYGTTTFAHTEGAHHNGTELSIQATDPEGYTERTEYLPNAPGVPFSYSQAPSGMYVINADENYRDSFYWDKDAYAAACTDSGGQVSCDYLKARMKHFQHKWPCCGLTSRIIGNVKYPLERNVWYDYAGQPWPLAPGRFQKPSDIGRVLPDGTTQITHYDYNAIGRMTQRIDPDGRETDYTYAANGVDLLEVRQKTASGYDTLARYTYNSQHEPLTYTDEAGKTTTYTYNSRGQRTSMTNALGQTTTYTYDSNGYLTAVINALGHTQHSYTYDSYGRLASDTDSQGYTRQYSYDALDRLTQITYPDGTSKMFTWNKLDIASYTDRLGNTTHFTYDADRNLIKVTDPMGQVTQYGHYPNGRLHTLTDPNGNTTTWTRDLEGRVIAKTYADGNGTTYAYDDADRLVNVTDAMGQITHYAYTVADRLVGISYENAQNPTPSVTFKYGAYYPRVASMTDGHGTTAYSYYPAGVVGAGQLEAQQGTDAHDSIQYAYDALGRLASRTVDGSQETYSYDAIGRRTGDDNALGNFTTAYLGDTDQPTLRTIAGVPYQVAYQYESNLGDRRLKAILNQTVSQGVTTPVEDYTFTSNDDGLFLSRAANDGTLSGPTGGRHRGWKQGHHYGWDHAPHWGVLAQLFGGTDPDESHRSAQGQASAHDDDRGHEDEHGGPPRRRNVAATTTQYTYDADLRLTTTQGGSSESYTYDPAGNITDASNASGSTTYLVNELNQIESANSTNYTYNADGELVDDGTNTYTWDAAGHLIEITNKQSGHTSQFAYDGFGRRISDTETDPSATPVTTRFLWCGLHMCENRDSTDAVLARYYPQGELQGGQVLFYAQDQVGSVTAVVDPSEQVVGRLSYDSYGNITSSSGTLSDFRYAGLYYHQATGLDLATYRAYNPVARRWISRDPLREDGGLNLYAYVDGNPNLGVDPYGLFTWNDPSTYPLLPPSVVSGVAGFGDALSGGLTNWARNQVGWNAVVNKCSDSYTAGEFSGIALTVAIGGAAGLDASGTREAGEEFSHWVPGRMGGPRSPWNGNYVPPETHALSDPYRYRFMPRSWKAANPMPNRAWQQWTRIPYVYKGAAVGGAYGAGGAAISSNCSCSQ